MIRIVPITPELVSDYKTVRLRSQRFTSLVQQHLLEYEMSRQIS